MNGILIRGGELYDPLSGERRFGELYMDGSAIAHAPEVAPERVIDAEGCLVIPGLIDYHAHFFRGGTENGVSADASCPCCGITTAVDGGSAGVGGYEAFRASTINSVTRIVSCLLVASGGQASDRYPENVDPALFDEERICDMFKRYRGELVGLKLRLSNSITDARGAEAALKRSIEIARLANTRLVVHVTDCPLPLDEVAAMLRPGDVMCHIFHGKGRHTCLEAHGKPLEGMWQARSRGVLFDGCNGRSNFDLEVARKAIQNGFYPDIISSDNNASSWFMPPMHTLPRILSKYIDLGMPLESVLNAATITPARLIGRPELATLADGTPADIAIFRLKHTKITHTDANGHTLTGNNALVPMMTFIGGQCAYCQCEVN